jgi:hypothetical protein
LLKSQFLTEPPLAEALSLAVRAVKSADQAATTVDRMAPAIERTLAVAENTPDLITSERDMAIKALQLELSHAIRFAQDERTTALAYLTEERIAALKTLAERLTIERKVLAEDLERTSMRAVDRATWRIAQLAAGVVAATFVGAILLLLLARRLFYQPVRP